MQAEFLSGYGIAMRLTIDVVQDRAAGTSTLKITTLELKSTDGNNHYGQYITGMIYLNDTPFARCSIMPYGGCQINALADRYTAGGDYVWSPEFWENPELTVPHWATGVCSVSIHADVSVASGSSEHLGAINETVTVDLPTIEPVKAAKIRVGEAELGKPVALTLEGTDDRAKYTVTWSCGDQSGTVAKDQTAAQYTVTLPEALKAASKDGKTVAVTFKAVTKKGTQTVGQSTVTVNATMPVTEINAGQVVAEDATTGEEMTVRIVGADSRVRYTVQMIVGNRTETLATETAARTIKYTPPDELAAQFPKAQRQEVTIRGIASDGDKEIGRQDKKIWLTAGTGTWVELGEITAEDVSSLRRSISSLIRGKSELRISAPVTAKYGATITEKQITIAFYEGATIKKAATDATFILDAVGNAEVTVSVKDSRGAGAVVTIMRGIYVRDYDKPTVRISRAYRCKQNGTADAQGDYARVVFSAKAITTTDLITEQQSIRYSIDMRKYGDPSGTVTSITAYDSQLTVTNGSVVVRLPTSEAYIAQITGQDKYDSGASTWVSIPAKYALMDFDRDNKAVGIGRKADTPNTLGIGMDMSMGGKKIQQVAAPTEDTDAATKAYVDGGGSASYAVFAPVGTAQNYGVYGIGVANNATDFMFNMPLTVPLKKAGRIEATGEFRVHLGVNGAFVNLPVTSISVRELYTTSVSLVAKTSGMTTGCVGMLTSNNDRGTKIEIFEA